MLNLTSLPLYHFQTSFGARRLLQTKSQKVGVQENHQDRFAFRSLTNTSQALTARAHDLEIISIAANGQDNSKSILLQQILDGTWKLKRQTARPIFAIPQPNDGIKDFSVKISDKALSGIKDLAHTGGYASVRSFLNALPAFIDSEKIRIKDDGSSSSSSSSSNDRKKKSFKINQSSYDALTQFATKQNQSLPNFFEALGTRGVELEFPEGVKPAYVASKSNSTLFYLTLTPTQQKRLLKLTTKQGYEEVPHFLTALSRESDYEITRAPVKAKGQKLNIEM